MQISVVTCKEFVFGDEFEGTCEEYLQRLWFYFWLHRGNWLTFILIILERFVERRFRLVSHLPSLLYFWFQFWCLSELKDPRPHSIVLPLRFSFNICYSNLIFCCPAPGEPACSIHLQEDLLEKVCVLLFGSGRNLRLGFFLSIYL